MTDVEKIMKTHIFTMKDADNKDICDLEFKMTTPCTFADAETQFCNFLVEYMDEPYNTLKSQTYSILKEWHENGKFPDGTFFFLKANNDFGFRISYMYKKAI